jgi:PAS domain S-box-containing protein
MHIYLAILAEFILISSSILLLFRFRSKIGLAPLFILLGAVQYLQAFSSSVVRFEILEKYPIYPSSIIIFSAVLFAILLIYIKEGVLKARTLIIGIVISNFLLSALTEITNVQESVLGLVNENSTNPVFSIDYEYFIIGTIILFIDFVLLVILYQFLITKINKRYFFLILLLSLTSILFFDSLAFNFIIKYNDPEFTASLIGHVIGKTFAAFIFSLILYWYLKYLDNETERNDFIANQNRNIFSILKYRDKYFKLKEEKEESEKKLVSNMETTLNNISDGFVSLDTNWCYTFVNKKAGEFLGRSPQSLIGKHIWTEFPDGVGLPFYNAYYKAVETKKTIYFQEFYEPFQKWFENRIYPSENGLTIYFTDITERKNSEENNQMLLSLIETSDDFIGLATLEGNPIYLNTLGRKMVGLGAEEAMPNNIKDFFPEHYHEAILNEHMPSIFTKKRWNGEVQLKNFKTGDLIPIEMSGFLISDSIKNTPLALGIVATNITERKKAEDLLKKNEKYLDNIINNVGDPIFVKDEQSRLLLVNDAFCDIFNLSKENIIGKTLAEEVPLEEQEVFLKVDREVISTGVENVNEETLTIRGGETRYILTKKTRFIDESGNKFLIGIIRDITERVKIEKRLKESEKYLDNIINNIGDPIFVKDEQSCFLLANNSFYNFFRRTKEEIIGKTFAEDVPQDLRDYYLKDDSKVLTTGIEVVNERSITREDGKVQHIYTKKTRFIDENGKKYLIGVVRDITNLKNVEIELEKHRNQLEELVKIRTEEVSLKNNELQRMNKLFVGRELKMRELKNIIKELKSKNEN